MDNDNVMTDSDDEELKCANVGGDINPFGGCHRDTIARSGDDDGEAAVQDDHTHKVINLTYNDSDIDTSSEEDESAFSYHLSGINTDYNTVGNGNNNESTPQPSTSKATSSSCSTFQFTDSSKMLSGCTVKLLRLRTSASVESNRLLQHELDLERRFEKFENGDFRVKVVPNTNKDNNDIEDETANASNVEDETELAEKRAKQCLKYGITRGEQFQGELEPNAMLPEEIWDTIIHLVTIQDRLNVCRTNSQLDNMFGRSKPQWLISIVLPHLMKHFTKKSALLKCRLVCKQWRNVVDNILEAEHPNRRAFNKHHPFEIISNKQASVYASLRRCQLEHIQFSPNNISKFLTFPSSTPEISIVIGRAVSFQINSVWEHETLNEFWTAAKQFLESQGERLWHFKIVQYNIRLTTLRFYRILSECLLLLPNLRTLEVKCHLEKVQFDTRESIRSIVNMFPLPHLPFLHTIGIEGVPKGIQEHILTSYGSQIEKLSLDMDIHQNDEVFPVNVKDLVAKRLRNDDDLFKLYRTTEVANRLTKLTLDMSLCSSIVGGTIVNTLNRLPLLVHLRLILHSRTTYVTSDYWKPVRNQVHNVEYFELEGDGRDIFYFSTLLFAFPVLKYIHLRDTSYWGLNGNRCVRKCVRQADTMVEIEKFLYNNMIHMSPIWDTLTELQIFTFENANATYKSVCDRETAEILRQRESQKTENNKVITS